MDRDPTSGLRGVALLMLTRTGSIVGYLRRIEEIHRGRSDMLHVLIARTLIDEREREIQRQLRENAWRRSRAAKAAEPTESGTGAKDPGANAADRSPGACPPATAIIS
jgi:hypothetical protein